MLIPIRRLSEEHQIISGPIPMGAFTDDIQKSFWFILTLSVESEHPNRVSHPKRLYYREPFSIFSVLAENDWRFGVVLGDGNSFPPKSRPLIGATGELLLFTFTSCGVSHPEA